MNPTATYDLKTGAAGLSRRRVDQLRRHLPGGGRGVDVVEIR